MSINALYIVINSPVCPDDMDWSSHYPAFFGKSSTEAENGKESIKNNNEKPRVEFADIGCGYGGLLGKTIQLKHHKRSKISQALT